MEKKKLGRSSLETAPFTLGGNVFGWTIDEPSSFKILDSFVGAGFNLVDTADVYSRWKAGNSGGESETIIGKWMKLRNNRHDVIVATKGGGDMGQGGIDISRKHILRAAEASLRRLQVDYIDLYQTHWDNVATPVTETLSAYDQLIKEGKVRYIGASNITPERLREFLVASDRENLPRYQSLQPEYNLYSREKYESDFEQICLENDLGVVNYYSLASGFLTGKYRSAADVHKSARGGGNMKYINARGLTILAALDEVAARLHATPATIALAWLIARPSITAPIASATSVSQLADLTRAAEIKLDLESIDQLNEASKP